MTLIKHFPLLQVLIFFFGALFAILSFHNIRIARFTTLVTSFIGFVISIYGAYAVQSNAFITISYFFGNWPAPIGIEYKLSNLNQLIIVYVNFVLLFFVSFGHELIKTTVLEYIDKKRRSLFYAVVLFAHFGYLGMISTHDLFNLYVFIEISSLSSYVLMASGYNPKAVVGAFDYLILGSIGATLILIGVGFLFSSTGCLNITDIVNSLSHQPNSRVIGCGISFFLVGAILKTAFFPMHFWMLKSYRSTAPVILIYFAGISSIIGIYVIFKFLYSVIDYPLIIKLLSQIIRLAALTTIILASYYALKAKDVKNIIIYSSLAQIGYVFLLLAISGGDALLFSLLIVDSLNKIALFFIVGYDEFYNSKIKYTALRCVLMSIILVCSSGLPLSSLFIIKLNIGNLLIENNLWGDLVIIMISSAIGLLYHYKIAKILFINKDTNSLVIENVSEARSIYYNYGLTFIVLLQVFLFIYVAPYISSKRWDFIGIN